MFTKSIKLYYTFYYQVLRVQKFEKCDSVKNEWLLFPARFKAKLGLVLGLTQENVFS